MQYSPNSDRLAVGSHDNNIYVYSVDNTYSKFAVLNKHQSFITSLDWSMDGDYIRSVCGAYELLFYKVPEKKQDPSGASNTVDTEWATMSCKLGWSVQGIFPPGTDGSHINGVDESNKKDLIATADDYGLVSIFNNPVLEDHKCRSFRGHSEHVVRVKFMMEDEYIISAGGYDKTIIQWRRKEAAN